MSIEVPFTKENLDYYLKELAKEYKKRSHGTPAELILVGGASVIINYEFRMSSYDIDTAYDARSVMKEAINAVGDRLGLPNVWVNDDFKKTSSYTPKIAQYSEYYKTFSNVLQIRTIRAEYLVAMKLMSARRYKKDTSDIAGIFYEQQIAGNPMTYDKVNTAVNQLYGGWDNISEYAKELLQKALECKDLKQLFIEFSADEMEAKAALLDVERRSPGTVQKDTIDSIIEVAKKRKMMKHDIDER